MITKKQPAKKKQLIKTGPEISQAVWAIRFLYLNNNLD